MEHTRMKLRKIEFDRIDVPRDGYVQENVLGAEYGAQSSSLI